MRYRACRWWRGGHAWSKWTLAPYRSYSMRGNIREEILNERTCEKCGRIQAKDIGGYR